MSGKLIIWSQENGRDTSYRTSKLDTHLTHGCIQLFRHFSRVRQGCAIFLEKRSRAIAPFLEGALRTLAEAAL